MSTEQEDVAMLLELEEKITRRIRAQIRNMIDGRADSLELHDSLLEPTAMHITLAMNVKNALLNDDYFIAQMTQKIGHRMSMTY